MTAHGAEEDAEDLLDVPTTLYLEECEAHRATLAAYIAMRKERDQLRADLAKANVLLKEIGEAAFIREVVEIEIAVWNGWQSRIDAHLAYIAPPGAGAMTATARGGAEGQDD